MTTETQKPIPPLSETTHPIALFDNYNLGAVIEKIGERRTELKIEDLIAQITTLRDALAYVDRQVREVWSPPPADSYQCIHRAWCMEKADEALKETAP